MKWKDSQLNFEILHDVQKVVVDLWLVLKLNLDSIQVCEGVSDVERSVGVWRPWNSARHG